MEFCCVAAILVHSKSKRLYFPVLLWTPRLSFFLWVCSLPLSPSFLPSSLPLMSWHGTVFCSGAPQGKPDFGESIELRLQASADSSGGVVSVSSAASNPMPHNQSSCADAHLVTPWR